jgi:hypothetical protein
MASGDYAPGASIYALHLWHSVVPHENIFAASVK